MDVSGSMYITISRKKSNNPTLGSPDGQPSIELKWQRKSKLEDGFSQIFIMDKNHHFHTISIHKRSWQPLGPLQKVKLLVGYM